MASPAKTKLEIPGYKLLKRLGSGAQASVFKATQLSMNRQVAIKVIPPSADKKDTDLARFLREARVLARLRHENIVSAIDYGEVQGYRYLVMELIEGTSVLELIQKGGAVGVRRSIEIVIQICRALAHASGFGVIHRDIKPANIVITDESRAVLVDFGLARREHSDALVTIAGMTVGTPHYMPPEQIRGEDVIDIRADLYALGGTFFHMLTGRTPFATSSKAETMAAHLKEDLVLPDDLAEPIPEFVFDVVRMAMEKDKVERYQSAEEMVSDLVACMEQLAASSSDSEADGLELLEEVSDTGSVAPTTISGKIRTLSAERDRLAAESRELSERLARTQEKARGLLGKTRADLETALREKQEVEERRAALEVEIRSAAARAEGLTEKLAGREAERRETLTRLSELTEEKSRLETRARELEAAAARAAGEADARRREAETKARDLVDRVTDLEAEAARRDEEVASLTEEAGHAREHLAAERERLDGEKRAVSTELRELKDEHLRLKAGLTRELEDVNRERAGLRERLSAVEDEGAHVERPRQEIYVDSFWIDVYPVTIRQYAEFVKDAEHPPPDYWQGADPPQNILDHPVVWVTWHDAAAYAEWSGKRLPTPHEWQKAARGTDGRRFPWGDEEDVARLNCRETGFLRTTKVGMFRTGASPHGLFDMAGNVVEWASGKFAARGQDGTPRVTRAACGGSWKDPLIRSVCAARRGYPDQGKGAHVGFRCARDGKPRDEEESA